MTAQANPLEFLAFCLAKTIKDHEVVYVGTGLPLIGGLLAKATHAPNSTLVFESGSQDRSLAPRPGRWAAPGPTIVLH
jgi:acyl CoA:acetate/3-ketoacid CoA transferase beta subunit